MWKRRIIQHTHTHTHTRLTALCLGLPGWAGTRKVKPIGILLKQETVSDSGVSWAIRKYAPRSRQITTPAPHHSVFTGQMPFLPPDQQRQSTERISQQVGKNAKMQDVNITQHSWWSLCSATDRCRCASSSSSVSRCASSSCWINAAHSLSRISSSSTPAVHCTPHSRTRLLTASLLQSKQWITSSVTHDPLTHTKTDPWPIMHYPWPTRLTTQPRTL